VLILSENAGSHEELEEWALTVNPFDIEGQAEAIYRAVTMTPGERHSRLAGIQAHVRAHDVSTWIDSQLEDLDRASARAST
jgi:trehalose 6-phosphate synthase